MYDEIKIRPKIIASKSSYKNLVYSQAAPEKYPTNDTLSF